MTEQTIFRIFANTKTLVTKAVANSNLSKVEMSECIADLLYPCSDSQFATL